MAMAMVMAMVMVRRSSGVVGPSYKYKERGERDDVTGAEDPDESRAV